MGASPDNRENVAVRAEDLTISATSVPIKEDTADNQQKTLYHAILEGWYLFISLLLFISPCRKKRIYGDFSG